MRKKITILHVYKDFHIYNAFFGALLLLARHTDFSRFNLHLCVFRYQKSEWGEQFEKLGGKIIDMGAGWTESPFVTLKILDYLKRERPEIVQTHELKANLYGRLAARLSGVPVVIGTIWTLKDTAASPRARLRDRCLHPFSAMLDSHSDAVLTSSDAIRRQWDPSLKSPLYQTIYTPYNLDRAAKAGPEELRKLEAMRASGVRIGAVSRLSEEKGIQYLLQSLPAIAAQFAEFQVYIAGEGPYRTNLEAIAASLNDRARIHFLGHVSDVAQFLQRLDIFVQPSRSESLGVAVMEAMSMGVPVVAANVGGIPEIIDDNATGILVPACDPKALAAALLGLCRDPQKRKIMGQRGKEAISQKFRVADFVKQTFDLYERLLRKKGIA
jgi:glycosyltransferase involved in cell wall biosynthesis